MISGLIMSLAAVHLSACQSTAPMVETIESGAAEIQAEYGLKSSGAGANRLGMITMTGVNADDRDYRDGALLAVDALGDGKAALNVFNARPTPDEMQTAMTEFAKDNVAIVIGPSRIDLANAIAAQSRAPVIALVTNAGQKNGAYSFISDPLDSVFPAMDYAASGGITSFLVLYPENIPADVLQRLRKGLDTRRFKASLVAIGSSDGWRTKAKSAAGASTHSAVVLVPGLVNASTLVAAMRKDASVGADTIIIGHSAMTTEDARNAELSGSLVCRIEPAAVADLPNKYREKFGRQISLQAAYGFDAAALGIGLLRAGDGKISKAGLTSRKGFSGMLGSFRFGSDGSVERQCAIYAMSDGRFTLVDPAPNGF